MNAAVLAVIAICTFETHPSHQPVMMTLRYFMGRKVWARCTVMGILVMAPVGACSACESPEEAAAKNAANVAAGNASRDENQRVLETCKKTPGLDWLSCYNRNKK